MDYTPMDDFSNEPIRYVVFAAMPDREGRDSAYYDYSESHNGMIYHAIVGVFDSGLEAAAAQVRATSQCGAVRAWVESYSANSFMLYPDYPDEGTK